MRDKFINVLFWTVVAVAILVTTVRRDHENSKRA